ncbi:cbb3-type cytochrome c oxidase subunit 3 [Halieaceae bacterium IMCC14734]|uniref:Cbb3-type cytochrome c oxidase subunit 3 n=1 Tax=Candidatus Litorirhabdus singularis TaxID=2518993 RepID=A0ABT3TKI2_9GAMM|nr:cbb3-type cytochrome c oxidase subunit 3 [Candidatus Litorirhabdus singularis]MCX2981872.1 cbb3-type cytochrome c oxidase subunit 3 [Candidatus Litorirhabdus singularis]
MDINTLRGLSTLFLLVVFIALVFWAYSDRRKKDFDEAANLPFVDDEPVESKDKVGEDS